MKRAIFILLISAQVFLVFAQKVDKSQLPKNVKVAFNVYFREAKNEKWWLDKNEYQCNFIKDGKKAYTVFTEEGQWLFTVIKITKKDLPSWVKKFIKTSNYGKYRIKTTVIYESSKHSKCYKITLKKGRQQAIILCDLDGSKVEITF